MTEPTLIGVDLADGDVNTPQLEQIRDALEDAGVDTRGRTLLQIFQEVAQEWKDTCQENELLKAIAARDDGPRLESENAHLKADVEVVLAQLRHAYSQLMGGLLGDHESFADGLIAPQIARLEKCLVGMSRRRHTT